MFQVNQATECSVDVKSIKEVHLITELDKMDGLLVQFAGKHRQQVDWEVHVKPRTNFVLIKPFGAISRITDLKVSCFI